MLSGDILAVGIGNGVEHNPLSVNLQRMNLIAVRMQTESKAPADVANNIYEDIYLLFEQVVERTRQQIVQQHPQYKERSVRLYAGEIVLTALGSRFLRVCKW